MTEDLKQWMKGKRLQNYGYDYKWFKRMSAYKTRVSKKLNSIPESEVRRALAREGILGKGRRLSKEPMRMKNSKGKWVNSGRRTWGYTTGQSFNEELLNMMSLGATKGKKSFYEVQDKWFE